MLIANVFQETKLFHQANCFSIRNFAYNTHETYFFDTSSYFDQQFLRFYYSALQ